MKTVKLFLSWVLIVFLVSRISHAKTLTILGDQVNVRSGPGRTHDIVEVVNQNEKFEILDEKDGWYKISVEGVIGWIAEKAATVTADIDIQELLQRADQYVARRQLTTPPEANAFDLYQEVLRKDPGNAHALKQIAHMAKIYKMYADNAYQRGEYEKAKTFYQRYLFLVPDDQRVQEFLARSNNPMLNPEAALQIVRLRTDPVTLDADAMIAMLRKYGFNHPADWAKYGLAPSMTGHFRHEYEVKPVNGVKVVIDYATTLMWQQVGTTNPMTWDKASAYIDRLNSTQYAGYADWRLPTLEELASLLESAKQPNNLYLAMVFGTNALWCWGIDQAVSADNAAWYVSFSSGGIQQHAVANTAFVLAVRSNR